MLRCSQFSHFECKVTKKISNHQKSQKSAQIPSIFLQFNQKPHHKTTSLNTKNTTLHIQSAARLKNLDSTASRASRTSSSNQSSNQNPRKAKRSRISRLSAQKQPKIPPIPSPILLAPYSLSTTYDKYTINIG